MKTSVPPYTVDSRENSGSILANRWVNGLIKINTDEIANRILSESGWNNGVNMPDAWAYHLNKSVKSGIEDIGTKHLVLGVNKTDLFGIFIAVASIASSYYPLFGYGFWLVMHNGIAPYMSRNSEGFRKSLFLTGPQLDRALLLKLISSRSTLVKSIMVAPWPEAKLNA